MAAILLSLLTLLRILSLQLLVQLQPFLLDALFDFVLSEALLG